MKTTAKTIRHAKIGKSSYDMNENNDCGVKAIAMACRVSYKASHTACENTGRKHRGYMYIFAVLVAARSLGFKTTPVKNLKQKNGCNFTPKTIGTKCKNGYYLVFYEKSCVSGNQ